MGTCVHHIPDILYISANGDLQGVQGKTVDIKVSIFNKNVLFA